MQAYEQEILDGLEDVLKEQNSIAFLSPAIAVTVDDSKKDEYKSILLDAAYADIENKQIDLMYIEDILASIGWNSNDDVFDPIETFRAKDTPVDKQFNFMHQQDKIIGHITSSKVVDIEGKVIAPSTKEENLPQYFDVISNSVIYTKYRDKTKQEEMDTLVAEILDNKWYVSMECLFPTFDFAIITASGEQRIIKRNKDTAYLTKYLKAYGGTGYVNGNKIGRLLRNFTFSGKGLVTNPANKKSVILNSIANVQFNATETIEQMEKVEMTIDQKMYDDLKAELAASKAEVTSLKSKTDESVANSFKNKVEGLEAQIASLTEKNTASANEVENYKKLSAEKDAKIVDLEKSVAEVNETLASTKTELESTKADIAKTSRLAKLVKVGVEDKKAEEIVTKFATASEEMFDEVVGLHALAKTVVVETPEAGKLQKTEKEEDKTGVNADIEGAEAEEVAPLNTSSSDKMVNIKAKVSEWLSKSSKK